MRQDAMTSKQDMPDRPPGRFAWICVAGLLCGCISGEKVEQPDRYTSPYPAPKLWAVAPLDNQTGTLLVDTTRLADKLTHQLQQIKGIETVAVNRVLEVMTEQKLTAITSIPEAMAVIEALDVDGLIVGAVTAWDPYEPPKIGLTVQLYARRNPNGTTSLDPRLLTASATDPLALAVVRYRQPVNHVAAYLDAGHGDVLTRLQRYAKGRSGHDSPAGWRRYLLSMDLYSEFASHELMRRLFAAEWERLTAADPAPGPADSNTEP